MISLDDFVSFLKVNALVPSTSAAIVLSSVGRRQPAGWVSPGQLWGDPGPDHRCLPEGPAQSTNRRSGNFQR